MEYVTLNNGVKMPILAEVGATHGKSVAQVALRFLIQNGVVVIPKSTHKERMEENFNVFDFALADEEMARIEALDGGFGLLFSGGTSTDNQVDGVETILSHPEEFIRVGQEMNSRLHAYGCKMFMQLSMNIGRNAGLKTPSPLPMWQNPAVTTEALTVDEIHVKIEVMVKAAKLCKDAGFAGVDIHALHWGHLIDSFALSFMNHREDEYGGSLENRLRVAKEIVEGIKRECGPDFPVTMRLALRSYMKGFDKASYDGSDEVGRTLEEAIEIGKLLESYGYDGLSTDAGTLDAYYYAMPPAYVKMGYTLDMAAELKKAVSIPVLCGSRMADPDMDEQAIADRKIDAVVIGRQTIADPDFAKKIVAGKPEEVRTCIGCNQGCIWGYFTKGKVSCAVNPEVGHELDWRITRAPVQKKVVIVGGGLVGCEIALGYLQEGKRVTMVEALDEIMKVGDVPAMNKIMLLDAFEYYNAPVCVNTRLKAVNDEGAVVTLADGTDQTIPADTVVMSVGYRPLPSLAADLAGCGAEIYEIGDGSRVGNVLTCIRDAFEVTRNL